MLEQCIAMLTTSFGLTSSRPALSRDLNSLLPGFFSALLKLSSQPSMMSFTLKALHVLIPENPSAFRTSVPMANLRVLSIIEGSYSLGTKKLAAKIFVDLAHPAPKGLMGEHWRASLLGIIAEVSSALDRLFEGFEEGAFRLFPYLTTA